jgi:hypothetical protein
MARAAAAERYSCRIANILVPHKWETAADHTGHEDRPDPRVLVLMPVFPISVTNACLWLSQGQWSLMEKCVAACGVRHPSWDSVEADNADSISANHTYRCDVGPIPRTLKLISSRCLCLGRSISGSMSEYSVIWSKTSWIWGIVQPSFPLKWIYAFLYVNCLWTTLWRRCINCCPQDWGRRFLGIWWRKRATSRSQCRVIHPSRRLSQPNLLLCSNTVIMSAQVSSKTSHGYFSPCVKVCPNRHRDRTVTQSWLNPWVQLINH